MVLGKSFAKRRCVARWPRTRRRPELKGPATLLLEGSPALVARNPLQSNLNEGASGKKNYNFRMFV